MVEEWERSIEVNITVFKKKKDERAHPPNESVTWYLLELLRADLDVCTCVNHCVLLQFLFQNCGVGEKHLTFEL